MAWGEVVVRVGNRVKKGVRIRIERGNQRGGIPRKNQEIYQETFLGRCFVSPVDCQYFGAGYYLIPRKRPTGSYLGVTLKLIIFHLSNPNPEQYHTCI